MVTIPEHTDARRRIVHSDILPTLDLRPFIGGQFITPSTDKFIKVIDPMTQEELARVPSANTTDVDAAVTAA